MEYWGNYAYFVLNSGGKCRIFVLETKCVPKTKKQIFAGAETIHALTD